MTSTRLIEIVFGLIFGAFGLACLTLGAVLLILSFQIITGRFNWDG